MTTEQGALAANQNWRAEIKLEHLQPHFSSMSQTWGNSSSRVPCWQLST